MAGQKVSIHSNMKEWHLLKKIQDTLYIEQWHLIYLQSRHLQTSHSSPSITSIVQNTAKSFVGITISCPIIFSWISLAVWNLFPFKGDFNFGKCQGGKSWLWGLSHLGDLMFCKKFLHEMWYMSRRVVIMKLPITSCPLLWACSLCCISQLTKNTEVVLINCLAWRGILMMNNTFHIKKNHS